MIRGIKGEIGEPGFQGKLLVFCKKIQTFSKICRILKEN